MDLARALEVASAAAMTAGEVLRREVHRPGGARGSGDRAPAEEEALVRLRMRLRTAFPEVAEGEGPGLRWLLAPLCATRAFLAGDRGFAVTVALIRDGVPVLGVVHAPAAPDDRGDTLAWYEGGPLLRNGSRIEPGPLPADPELVLGAPGSDRTARALSDCVRPARYRGVASVGYRLALVAAGEADAAIVVDHAASRYLAAGHALLRAVGGEVLDPRGEPIRHDRGTANNAFAGSTRAARALASRSYSDVLAGGAPDPFAERHPLVRPWPGRLLEGQEIVDRAAGCLLGLLSGDVVGGGSGAELSLLCGRTMAKGGDWDRAAVLDAYREWLESGPAEAPGAIRRALAGQPDRLSQGNAALTRAAVIGVFAHGLLPGAAAHLAGEDAALTHPNPVCRDASGAVAVAIGELLRTGDPRAGHTEALAWARSQAVSPIVEALETCTDGPPPDFTSQPGWVLVALRNAFHELLHAAGAMEGIAETVERGGDSAANAAVAGALLGAVSGRRSLPPPLLRAALGCRSAPRGRPLGPFDVLDMAERLAFLGTSAGPEAA